MPVRSARISRKTRGPLAAIAFTAIAFHTLWTPATAADSRRLDPVTIALLVDDRAQLSDRELEAAQKLAGAVLWTAGLRPLWLDGQASAPPTAVTSFWIVLGARQKSEQMIARLGASSELLGAAPARTRRVYVFPERIRHVAAQTRRRFEEVLGHVLAHEIGHHLLPGKGHTDAGIMQADISRAFVTPWFTRDQGRSIRSLLSGAHQPPVVLSTPTEGQRSGERARAPEP